MAGNCTKLCFIAIFLLGLLVEAQEYALVREQKLFGYIDRTGHYAIEPRYKEARSFSNGLAAVKVGKKWGYIDAKGNEIIKSQYNRAGDFDSGIALVEMDGQWHYIKKNGDQLEVSGVYKYHDFKNGVAVCGDGEKKGLIGTDGKWIVEPKYEVIQKFVNKHAKVRLKGFWGIIDTGGKEIVPLEYDNIGNYHPNGLWAKRGKTFGVISKDGVFQPVVKVDRIWDFQDGSTLAITEGQNNKFGFIDGRGNWVIEPIFKEVLPFSEGLAPAYLKRKWGFIKENGEFVIEERFNGAGTFSKNGLAPIRTGYWGFTNKEGEIVIDPRYFITTHEPVKALPYIKIAMETNGFVNGWALVFKVDNGFVFINDKGEVLGDKRFEYAAPFTEVD